MLILAIVIRTLFVLRIQSKTYQDPIGRVMMLRGKMMGCGGGGGIARAEVAGNIVESSFLS